MPMVASHKSPDLISSDRIRHEAMRTTEEYLKRQTFRVENAAVVALLALYRETHNALRAFAITRADDLDIRTLGSDVLSRMWRDDMLDAVQQAIERLSVRTEALVTRYGAAALKGGYFGRLWLLDAITRDDVTIRMDAALGGITESAMLREDYYSSLITDLLGKQWRDQYALELDDLMMQIRRAIGQGVINGEGIPDVMRRVRDAMGVVTDRRRGAAGSVTRAGYRANFNRVQTLTRTVINDLSNRGAVSAYRANRDVLQGYEILVAHDERTCDICRPLDGKRFGMKSNFRPPFHPNCRCSVIPWLKDGVLEPGQDKPRQSFKAWAQSFGMERELADFLVPKA